MNSTLLTNLGRYVVAQHRYNELKSVYLYMLDDWEKHKVGFIETPDHIKDTERQFQEASVNLTNIINDIDNIVNPLETVSDV